MDVLKPIRKVAGAMMGKGPKLPTSIAQQRLNKCFECNKYFKYTRQCVLCGCFVEEKTKYQDEHCKLGKW